MAGNMTFDATTVPPDKGYEPIPEGKYPVFVTNSAWETTKDGTGSMLKLDLEVFEGEYKGRKLFARFNLKNKSDQAVKIAQGQLSAICHAIGVLKVNDSSELHNKPFVAKVVVERREDTQGLKNECKSYHAYDQNAPTGAAAAAPVAAAAPAADKPWLRK